MSIKEKIGIHIQIEAQNRENLKRWKEEQK